MRCKTPLLAALAAAIVLSYASTARATVYVIDPSQSTLAVTGSTADTIPIVPQFPGSGVMTLAGTIDASDDGSSITFNGAAADAQLQPLPQSPNVGGGAGSAPADVGLSIGPGLGTIAIRDFVFGITGSPTPLVGGTTFALPALTITVLSGNLDYNVPAFALIGSADMTGETTIPTAGSGTLVGGVLTIPISVVLSFEVSAGPPPVLAHIPLVGQIVAVLVPEPGSIVLLGVGLVGLVAAGYRRRRS